MNRSSSMRLSSTWNGESGNNFFGGKYGKLVTAPNSFFNYEQSHYTKIMSNNQRTGANKTANDTLS